MNKGYNIWIFILSILTLIYTYLLVIQETVGSFKGFTLLKASLEYREIIYAGIAALIFLAGGRRAMKKWSGIKIVGKIEKFKFNSSISAERKRHVLVNTLIETVAQLLLAIAFLIFAPTFLVIPFVLIVLVIDSLINLWLGIKKEKYRIGLTNKAIVLSDREVKAIYFKGLKQITKQKNTIFFEYINDLVLDLPINTIPENKQEEFFEILQGTIDKTTVYFSGFEIEII